MISIRENHMSPADGGSRQDLATAHSVIPKGTLSLGRLHEVGAAQSARDGDGSATRRVHDPWAGTLLPPTTEAVAGGRTTRG